MRLQSLSLIYILSFIASITFASEPTQNCNGTLVPRFDNGAPAGYACVEQEIAPSRLKVGGNISAPNNTSDEYSVIFNKLHLRHGDTMLQANEVDSNSADFLSTILSSYKAGKLCIKYKRDEQMRKSCYSRIANREHVGDTAIK